MPEITVDSFTDERFGQVDLSAFPQFDNPDMEGFDADDPHGFNQVERSGASGLRALADNPDAETLDRIASETGDNTLLATVAEEKEYRESLKFVAAFPGYYKLDSNLEAIRTYLAEKQLPFVFANLAVAYKTLLAAGELEVDPSKAKKLTNSEYLHVIATAKEGKAAEALDLYLSYSLPNAAEAWETSQEFLTDPNTVKVRNAAVRLIFLQTYPELSDTEEFRAFESNFFHNHPLRTLQDYGKMGQLYQTQDKAATRERVLFGPEKVKQTDLESLSDDQIATLTRQSLRKRLKERQNGG
jgi:hypothetical protein